MIIGHGIDLQEITKIAAALSRHTGFAQKVLTQKEYQCFLKFPPKRQLNYLAGRWAAKEAFAKALGSGIGQVTFQEIEILADEKGRPFISQSPFKGRSHVSISHSGDYAQASVILEATGECDDS